MSQLPAGVEGVAAGVLIWSFVCLTSNVVLLWLLWVCNERRSYIFIVAWITLLATVTSIIEQIHDMRFYEDIMWERLNWIKNDPDNALMISSSANVGLSLVMWTIRWGCYIGESGIAFFWAFSLTQSVYGWRDDVRFYRPLILINQAGKLIPILAAAFTMGLLQTKALQASYWWFNFVMNFFYCAFLAGANLMFLLIFVEYLQTRRLFRRMNSQQRRDYVRQPSFPSVADSGHHGQQQHHQLHHHHGLPQPLHTHGRSGSTATSIVTTAGRPQSATGSHFGALQQRQGGIYDRWLVARTTLCVIALTAFEVDNILINAGHPAAMRRLAATARPDLSAATAQAFFGGFMPGCLASLIVALAFGTTKHLRGHLRRALVAPRGGCFCGLFSSSSSTSAAAAPSMTTNTMASSSSTMRGSSRPHGHKHHRSDDFRRRRYMSMDTDNGILSRRKRLSMEKQLRIKVTYEFEIRNEQVEVSPSLKAPAASGVGGGAGGGGKVGGGGGGSVGGGGGGGGGKGAREVLAGVLPVAKSVGSRTYPYSVESHRWDDTERILPKKPSISIMRGNSS